MPRVWLVETGEEALRIRLLGRRAGYVGNLHRAAQVLWNVRNRQAAFSLAADFAGGNLHERFDGPCRPLPQKFLARVFAGGDC